MDSIKHSIQELSVHFNTKMAEFQQNLSASIPATSPNSNIAAQFNLFRSFVLSSLEALQNQVDLLSNQCDQMEMRSRRNILLIHGIPEDKKENVSAAAVKVLSNHLDLPDLTLNDVSHCQRLGKLSSDKPRVILLKFKELSCRNQVWFTKSSLKNTGFTLSEFLTKQRHDTFMTARQRFGVSKCWTKNGVIIVIGSDGVRHSITTKTELNMISSETVVQTQTTSKIVENVAPSGKPRIPPLLRGKRHIKK